MPKKKEPRQDRIRELVDELEREMGDSQAAVARRIGLSPDHLARVRKGERRVSIERMADIATRVGISRDFFDGASGTSYRDFPAKQSAGPLAGYENASTTPGALASIEASAGAVLVALGGNPESVDDAARALAAQIMSLPAVRSAVAVQHSHSPIDAATARKLALDAIDLDFRH